MVLLVTTIRLNLTAQVLLSLEIVIKIDFLRVVEMPLHLVWLQVYRRQFQPVSKGHVPLVLVLLRGLRVLVFVLLQLAL